MKTLSEPAIDLLDSRAMPVTLGDRAVDLNTGIECVVLDHCPELGPDSLYVQMVGHGGPEMSYWVQPRRLMRLRGARE